MENDTGFSRRSTSGWQGRHRERCAPVLQGADRRVRLQRHRHLPRWRKTSDTQSIGAAKHLRTDLRQFFNYPTVPSNLARRRFPRPRIRKFEDFASSHELDVSLGGLRTALTSNSPFRSLRFFGSRAADSILSLIENIPCADSELFNVELSTVTGILNKPGPEQRIASLHRTS